jgi:hypothetical protein
MKSKTDKHITKVLREFDEKVFELKRLAPKGNSDSESVDFGYRCRKDGWIWTIPDWGNIKHFITTAILDERERICEELDKKWVYSEDVYDSGFNKGIEYAQEVVKGNYERT